MESRTLGTIRNCVGRDSRRCFFSDLNIDPAQWASLCRFIGSRNPGAFDAIVKMVKGSRDKGEIVASFSVFAQPPAEKLIFPYSEQDCYKRSPGSKLGGIRASDWGELDCYFQSILALLSARSTQTEVRSNDLVYTQPCRFAGPFGSPRGL